MLRLALRTGSAKAGNVDQPLALIIDRHTDGLVPPYTDVGRRTPGSTRLPAGQPAETTVAPCSGMLSNRRVPPCDSTLALTA